MCLAIFGSTTTIGAVLRLALKCAPADPRGRVRGGMQDGDAIKLLKSRTARIPPREGRASCACRRNRGGAEALCSRHKAP
jgi:hypothetical protein